MDSLSYKQTGAFCCLKKSEMTEVIEIVENLIRNTQLYNFMFHNNAVSIESISFKIIKRKKHRDLIVIDGLFNCPY